MLEINKTESITSMSIVRGDKMEQTQQIVHWTDAPELVSLNRAMKALNESVLSGGPERVVHWTD